MSTQEEFTDGLIRHGYWIRTDVQGIFGRTAAFEKIVTGFDALIVYVAHSTGAERVDFPPVVSREVIRRVAYMESFPELCGSIHSFRSTGAKHMDLVDRVDEGSGDGGGGEFVG